MSGIDQSIRIVDLDKDCDEFHLSFHEVKSE